MLKKRSAAIILALMLAAFSINSYVYSDEIQVNIEVDGMTTKTFVTKADTVKDILVEGGIDLEEGDVVSPESNFKLTEDSTISVKSLKNVVLYNDGIDYNVETNAITTGELAKEVPYLVGKDNSIISTETKEAGSVVDGGTYEVKDAFPVFIYADNATHKVNISEGTVATALKKAAIEIDENDAVYPSITDEVYEGMEVSVTRVAVTHDRETVTIPHTVEYRINRNLAPYEEVTTQIGSDGEMIRDNIITFHNGEIVGFETKENITKQAVNTIVECGVYNVKRFDQNAAPAVGTVNGYAYSKVIKAKATAYCDKGRTATSISSKVGVVAVDPRVIPLGTRLYIESTDGSWSYGVCLAGDTGGLIKGNRVDLFYDTYDECIQFGRRDCNIYILAD